MPADRVWRPNHKIPFPEKRKSRTSKKYCVLAKKKPPADAHGASN